MKPHLKQGDKPEVKERQLHCDSCGKGVGTYLYGKGGIEERAIIFPSRNSISLPDIVCNECWKEGYTVENPKDRLKVYGKSL